MAKALISVIIPYYNLGKYIDEAVASILNQTYKNWELIIVDDGSTDSSSKEALEKHVNHSDKRIKVLKKENSGLPATRNYAIEQSNGEYICCLDADDKYHPEFLQKTFDEIVKDTTVGFVTSWFQPFGEIEGENTIVQIPKNTPLFLVKNIPHVASLFRRACWEKISGYDVNMKHGYQDWDFWLSIVEAGYDWAVVNEVLFFYRVRSDSMLRETGKRDEENYEYLLKKHAKLFERINFQDTLRAARKTLFDYDLIINNLNKENKELGQALIDLKDSRLFKTYSKIKKLIK